MRWVMALALLALLAGCTATVSGSPAGNAEPTGRTTVAPTTETSTEDTSVPAPPTEIDPAADQQYCENTITGAFGKEMQVVVGNTPCGRSDGDRGGGGGGA